MYFYPVVWVIFTLTFIFFGTYLYLFFNGHKYLTIRDINKPDITRSEAKVTVIIPFRDATEELLNWLNAFEKVKLASLAEVLLINDGSINSLLKLRNRIRMYPNVRLLDRFHQGKKKAIEYGVSIASSELIVCTDADTIPHTNWLAGILHCFENTNVQMVCGRVAPLGGLWLASIDFLALMAAGEILIKKHLPVMCSGSNMAFRKEAFEAVEGFRGYHHFRSGDDVLLLHKIKSHYGTSAIAVCDIDLSYVSTEMPSTLGKFLGQRHRWGGKTFYYRDGFSVFLATVVLVCAVMTYGIFLIVWQNTILTILAALLVGSKIYTDTRLIKTYAKVVHVAVSYKDLVRAVLVYPFYIGFTFLRILVNPNPRWK